MNLKLKKKKKLRTRFHLKKSGESSKSVFRERDVGLLSRIFASYQNRNTEELRCDNESKLKLCKVETLTRWRKEDNDDRRRKVDQNTFFYFLFSIFHFFTFFYWTLNGSFILSRRPKNSFGLKKKGDYTIATTNIAISTNIRCKMTILPLWISYTPNHSPFLFHFYLMTPTPFPILSHIIFSSNSFVGHNWDLVSFFSNFNQQNHDFIFFRVSQLNHDSVVIFFAKNVWFLSNFWIYQMFLCRVYLDWNTFIFDEVTMSSGWKNMMDESQNIFLPSQSSRWNACR